jgi:hypothetical protein
MLETPAQDTIQIMTEEQKEMISALVYIYAELNDITKKQFFKRLAMILNL